MDYLTQEVVVRNNSFINVVMIYCEEMASREVTNEDLVHDFIENPFGSGERRVIYDGPWIPIRGTVTGSFNEPLIAMITVEGTPPFGLSTNRYGNFAVNVPKNGVLHFDFRSVPSQKIILDDQQVINVVMETHLLADDDEILMFHLEHQNSLLMEAKSLRDDYIVVRTETQHRTDGILCRCCSSPITSKTIAGTITNLENQPMRGVSISLKEANSWTPTNLDGQFTRVARITQTTDAVELELSAWGRFPQTIDITNDTVQTVPMIVDREFVDTFIENTLRGQAKRESMNRVTGTITDKLGEPLSGGVVFVKEDRRIGAVTNIDGEFTLNNVPPNSTLQFSFLGFISQEIAVDNRQVIDVMMEEDRELLGDIIVTTGPTPSRFLAEPTTITGIVTNLQNEPMEGVRVTVNGTDRRTVTDRYGRYSILVSRNQTMRFHITAYYVEEVRIDNQQEVDVVMERYDLSQYQPVVHLEKQPCFE